MTAQNIAFRSKTEREQEIKLLEQYKQIGIASIAAAAAAMRTRQPVRQPVLATRPVLRAS